MPSKKDYPAQGLVDFCGKLAGLVVSNLLWLLCCLPVVTAGSAGKALYGNCFRLLRGEEVSAKTFWQDFRRDFGRTSGLWCIILFAFFVLGLDIRLIAGMALGAKIAILILPCFCVLALVLFVGMVLPMLSLHPQSIRDAAVNGVLLSIGNLPKMLLVTAVNLVPGIVFLLSGKIFAMLLPLWLLCGGSLIALYNAKLLQPILVSGEQE